MKSLIAQLQDQLCNKIFSGAISQFPNSKNQRKILKSHDPSMIIEQQVLFNDAIYLLRWDDTGGKDWTTVHTVSML